ncbi:MarP family serine protease [Microbacterium sediminicola]|uniref:MarP family serine protease n=1 Tax=Microbacterium sediminicola TaxID=415210 RepID=A0ABP4U220_9MICO
MIVFDVLLVVLLVVATLIGLQRGFFASLGSFAGLLAGGIAAYWLMPIVGDLVPAAEWRTVAVIGAGAVLLVIGTAIGGAIGRAVRGGVDRIKLRVPERMLGGALSLVAAALAMSFVGNAVATMGIPFLSTAVANSSVLRTIDDLTPAPVRGAIAQARGIVLDQGIPQLGILLELTPTDQAPQVALDDAALQAAAQSVARVSGVAYACGTAATGSGFAIAADLIVTNAHVVAGVETPLVELPGRAAQEGRIVYFDAADDLAVIAVDGLDAVALPIAAPLPTGSSAAVQGYPYGGPLTSGTAYVLTVAQMQVEDVYGQTSSAREVYALQAVVRPGNSGGPVLTTDGEVAGVVFARAEDDDDLGYAMTTTELMPILAQTGSLTDTVSSGACTS